LSRRSSSGVGSGSFSASKEGEVEKTGDGARRVFILEMREFLEAFDIGQHSGDKIVL
jgi:hypothetical protein